MKIYVAENLDGVNQAMVIASNLAEAARRMRTSTYQLRQYGWHVASEGDAREILIQAHNEVLFRPIDHRPNKTYWRRRRWTTKEVQAAKAA